MATGATVHHGAAEIDLREERAADIAAIASVHQQAFGGDAEARLVEQLRHDGDVIASLVATRGERVVGHVLFSALPIATERGPIRSAALAPVAVVPERQGLGVGSALI